MRLIDADEITKSEHQHYDYMADEYYVFVRDIENAPTIEVEPVKHGHWVGIDDFPHETWECDRCGIIVETDVPPNYCENCGAQMFDEDINVLNKKDEMEDEKSD